MRGISAQDSQAQGAAASTGASTNETLPLRRIALYSSGVGYFEHSGSVQESLAFPLSLPAYMVPDALKSLSITQNPQRPNATPIITYPSGNSLWQALRSLRINLADNPGIPDILGSLRGAEIELAAPASIKGRIIGVEHRRGIADRQTGAMRDEIFLALNTAVGIRSVNIQDVTGFSFTDPGLAADLERALNLLAADRNTDIRELLIQLPGSGLRTVQLSYVLPVPVWKVSYRLDLSKSTPTLQGWAIIDNDGDQDWQNVELALVSGRPVSFIQDLYSPYHLARPILPLNIPGVAQNRLYESGTGYGNSREMEYNDEVAPTAQSARQRVMEERSYAAPEYDSAAPAQSVAGSLQTAQGNALGEQFEFTLPNLLTLNRRQSAMVPLVDASIEAQKFLVYTAALGQSASHANPAICVELHNATGLKLPPGPITVYDKGSYAGDALIEFFPEGERRLIAYGEDLSVSASFNPTSDRTINTVTIRSGVMTINRKQLYQRDYQFRNASEEAKAIILEHPITANTELLEPTVYRDKTASRYRFLLTLAPGTTVNLTVKEEAPLSERITLSTLRPEMLLSYSTNGEIPAQVRAVLAQAVELYRRVEELRTNQAALESQRQRLISEQDRIRRNMEALGSQTPQGQNYLHRMVELDAQIDEINAQIAQGNQDSAVAQEALARFLNTIEL